MATNPIVISSFQWGLANDKNRGQKWAFWDAQGIEIRKNSEYVTLNRGVTETFSSVGITSPVVAITTTNYVDSSSSNSVSFLINELNAFTSNWKIYENSTWEIWSLPSSDTITNVFNTGWYNYILGWSSLYRFTNAVRENILATNTFSSGWTGTNWSFTSWALHTAWSTVALTQSSPLVTVIGERYHIICDLWISFSGTCTVSIGWTTSSNLTIGRNDIYLTTSTTAWISFTPSSTFDGTISYVRVDRVSDLASSNWLGIKLLWSLTASQTRRPVISFYWDLIIWDWTQVARYNKDGTIQVFSTATEYPVIGWLDGTVYAITQIWSNIYVWCNNGWSTNMYIWDWLSSRPTQKVTYPDKPVINVALLNNQHYWWTEKGTQSIKSVMIWEWYQVQRYITSDIPNAFGTETLDDPDRLALYWTYTNAIETYGDIVYFPWYGKIYGFGWYFPWDPVAFNKEITFNGTECTAMLTVLTGGIGIWSNIKDFTPYMTIAYLRSWVYYLWIIDFRDYNWTYVSDGYLETMEYLGGNLWIEKNQKKLLVPFYLPHSSTSIEVYERKNQAGSYTLIKTINTTDYGTGFNVAEIADTWKWNTIQWKFKLITSNATYSPRLYVGITNILLDTANRNG